MPLTIDGSWRLLEGNRNRIGPGTVRLTVHPPLAAGDARDKAALAERVRGIVASALPPEGTAESDSVSDSVSVSEKRSQIT